MTRAMYRRIADVGGRRLGTRKGKNILKEAEPFIGRNIWTEIADADQQFGDRLSKGIFAPFSQSTVEANKLYLLGTISKEENKAGKLSAERLADLRLEAGRWRDMGRDVKSIVGSTSIGEAATKYKGWAIPIMRTNIANLTEISKKLRNKEVGEAITSREMQETYRALELATVLTVVGTYVSGQEEDKTFVGKMKARAYQEANTFLGGINPVTIAQTPRLYGFVQDLLGNLEEIAKWEQYQQDSQWGEKGDLKGVKGLQRQFTPRVISQITEGSDSEKTNPLRDTGSSGQRTNPLKETSSESGSRENPLRN